MPLREQDKLTILKDILQNHQLDCCGTVSECQQIQRLIQSIIGNNHLTENTQQTLENIYLYSQEAQNSQALDQYVLSYQNELNQWVNHLDNGDFL